jgi:dihydrodipicolinate synthase/N-acetylneuraminate lyase
MKIQGPVFAIVTPFDAAGDVDCGALDDYLRFLSRHGVQNIVVNGTTGEFASLTLQERMRLIERCRKGFDGTIVNHISSSSSRDCRMLLEHSRDHADAVLLLPPFYYANIEEAGCLAFFREVLAKNRLPAFLYNFPEHTQFQISPDMLRLLSAECESLVGIKDSGGDLQVSKAYKQAAPSIQVFVGSDRWALEVLKMGLDGSVTGCGNPVPELLVAVHTRFMSADDEAAAQAQQSFDRWTDFREGLPVNHLSVTKAGLAARIPGFPPHVRHPFVTADPASIECVRKALKEMGLD